MLAWILGIIGIIVIGVFVYSLCRIAAAADAHIENAIAKARILDHFADVRGVEDD